MQLQHTLQLFTLVVPVDLDSLEVLVHKIYYWLTAQFSYVPVSAYIYWKPFFNSLNI